MYMSMSPLKQAVTSLGSPASRQPCERKTYHPTKPYNRCVRVRPRNLNAESPSKNCVSGMTPPAASRLNQPLDAAISLCAQELSGMGLLEGESGGADGRCTADGRMRGGQQALGGVAAAETMPV